MCKGGGGAPGGGGQKGERHREKVSPEPAGKVRYLIDQGGGVEVPREVHRYVDTRNLELVLRSTSVPLISMGVCVPSFDFL